MSDIAKIAKIVGVEADAKGEYPFEVLDTKDSLVLIHYNTDTIGKYPLDSRVRDLRGVIVDTETEEIVCSSFGYIPTATVDEVESIHDSAAKTLTVKDDDGFEHSIKDVSFFEVVEGAMIRVWKHRDTIMFSTHKRIDCSNSHWGKSKNFLELFQEYATDIDFSKLIDGNQVLYFILLNKNLMITSKYDMKGRDGMIVYIGSRDSKNESLESTFIDDEIKTNCKNYKSFALPEEFDKLDLGDFIGVYYENGKRKVVRVVSSGVKKTLDLCGNDPNILHRMYSLLDLCQFPKSGEDTYFDNFKLTPILKPSRIEKLERPVSIHELFADKTLSCFTDQQVLDKKDPKVHENRIVNAMMYFSTIVSPCHQLEVLRNIRVLLTQRVKLIKVLQTNYEKFAIGNFEGYPKNKKSEKTFKHVQNRVANAVNFAKKEVRGAKLIPMIRHNIMTGVMRDTGKNVYSMVKIFVKDE